MNFSGLRAHFVIVLSVFSGWLLFPDVANADDVNPFEPIPITVLQLQGNGVSPEYATTVSELLSVELSRFPELRVTNDADLRRMMDLEAEKQSMGCDESSCLLEIASALGTRYVVWGSVGKLGNLVVVTVNLFDSDVQRSVNRESGQAPSIEKAPEMLGPLAKRLAMPIFPEHVRVAQSQAVKTTSSTASTAPVSRPTKAKKQARPQKSDGTGQNILGWGSLLLGASSFTLGYCGEIVGSSISAELNPGYEAIVPLSFLPLVGPPLVAIAGDATETECAAGCLAFSCQVAGCAGMIGGTTLLLWDGDENDRRQARAGVDASLYGWLPAPLRTLEIGDGEGDQATGPERRLQSSLERMAF